MVLHVTAGVMLHVTARLGGSVLGRSLIGSVLGSGLAAPALVRAATFTVPRLDYSFIGVTAEEKSWALNVLESEFDVNWQPTQATPPSPAASAASSSAALSKAAAKIAETSALGIFDRPMEPAEVMAEAAAPAAPEKNDFWRNTC